MNDQDGKQPSPAYGRELAAVANLLVGFILLFVFMYRIAGWDGVFVVIGLTLIMTGFALAFRRTSA
jgi:hypothetical protein